MLVVIGCNPLLILKIILNIRLTLPLVTVMGEELLDRFSLLHFSSGIIAYFFGIGWMQWFILHSLFELLENTQIGMELINGLFPFWPGGKSQPDSFINSVGDSLAAMVGWWIAYQVSRINSELN